MKKLVLTLMICSFFAATSVFGQQWSGSTSTSGNIGRTGNVGIGTTNPSSLLHLYNYYSPATLKLAQYHTWLELESNATTGNIDFNYSSAASGLSTSGTAMSIGRFSGEYFMSVNMLAKTRFSSIAEFDGLTIFNGNAEFLGQTEFTANVGIGTANPLKLLHVEGGDLLIKNGRLLLSDGDNQIELKSDGLVHAREIEVDLVTIPDYVFEDDYDLMPLTELQKFIDLNRHLPNIKSAAEYEERGSIALKELNIKLLEKVEELTLYTLEQEKEIEALKAANAEIESLKKQMVEMQKMLQQLSDNTKN